MRDYRQKNDEKQSENGLNASKRPKIKEKRLIFGTREFSKRRKSPEKRNSHILVNNLAFSIVLVRMKTELKYNTNNLNTIATHAEH